MMGSRDDARERDGRWNSLDERVSDNWAQDRDWRALGDGRYAIWMTMPWGVEVPALAVVSSVWGWPKRAESRDPRWTAFALGPAVVAIRFLGAMAERDDNDGSDQTNVMGPHEDADLSVMNDSAGAGPACQALETTSLPAA